MRGQYNVSQAPGREHLHGLDNISDAPISSGNWIFYLLEPSHSFKSLASTLNVKDIDGTGKISIGLCSLAYKLYNIAIVSDLRKLFTLLVLFAAFTK